MFTFKNFSIKARLIFVLSVLSLQLVAGAGLGLMGLNKDQESMQSIHDNRLVSLEYLDTVMRQSIRSEAIIGLAATSPAAQLPGYLETIEADNAVLHKAWDKYLTRPMDDNEKRLADDFISKRNAFEKEALVPVVAALKAGDSPRATQLLHEKLVPMFRILREPGNALVNLQVDEAAKVSQMTQERYVLVRNLCLGGLAFGLLLAVGVGTWLIRSIVGPLNKAVEVAQKVAQGDLTTRIESTSEDETGQLLKALRAMTESLTDIVKGVRTGTETISLASSEIAQGNQDLSSRTEQQAGALEETAASMEELTQTVKQTADNARQANALVQASSSNAQAGGVVMAEVMDTMGEINNASNKIADIITVIDGIAFQTNILALNAAVEAARAGEQGRGFAVVASEVRTLAQRSAQAAKEIKALIVNSNEKVTHGVELVEKAGTAMTSIAESIKRVADISAEIGDATSQQSSGISQVTESVGQLDSVTQQNAALVEEAAAAASSMQQEAQRLAQAVSVFQIASSVAPEFNAAKAALGVAAKTEVPRKASTLARATPAAPQVKATVRAQSTLASMHASTRAQRGTEVASGEWEEF